MTQFHITCWEADGHCSNLRCVVDVIEAMTKVQRRTGNKPILVHCRYISISASYMISVEMPDHDQ